jgi:hypothetical protein
MRAREILTEVFGAKLAGIDSRLVKLSFDAVEALLKCERLTLTDLGRALPRDCVRKHAIKCVDRLLANPRIEAIRTQVGAAVSRALFEANPSPVVLVDWTEAGPGFWALSAATPVSGRAIALFHEVHPTAKLSNPDVERRFLQTLKDKVVPDDCTPVMVTDSGFKTGWFLGVLDVGWDFVGRLGGSMQVSGELDNAEDPSAWKTLPAIYLRANHRPQYLGLWALTKKHRLTSRLILHKRPRKGRKGSRKPNRKGVHPGSHAVQTVRKRAKEPWLLATSVTRLPKEVVAIYALRMQIEETFRDTKSHRFGWSFEDAGSRTERRLNNLLLIAVLGAYVTMVLGVAAEAQGVHTGLQANTIRRRRVFSLFFLGRMVMSMPDLYESLRSRFRAALATLAQLVRDASLQSAVNGLSQSAK